MLFALCCCVIPIPTDALLVGFGVSKTERGCAGQSFGSRSDNDLVLVRHAGAAAINKLVNCYKNFTYFRITKQWHAIGKERDVMERGKLVTRTPWHTAMEASAGTSVPVVVI